MMSLVWLSVMGALLTLASMFLVPANGLSFVWGAAAAFDLSIRVLSVVAVVSKAKWAMLSVWLVCVFSAISSLAMVYFENEVVPYPGFYVAAVCGFHALIANAGVEAAQSFRLNRHGLGGIGPRDLARTGQLLKSGFVVGLVWDGLGQLPASIVACFLMIECLSRRKRIGANLRH